MSCNEEQHSRWRYSNCKFFKINRTEETERLPKVHISIHKNTFYKQVYMQRDSIVKKREINLQMNTHTHTHRERPRDRESEE